MRKGLLSFIHFTTSAVKSHMSCRLFDTSTTLGLVTNCSSVWWLHNLWQPGSRAAIKCRENKKMKRK